MTMHEPSREDRILQIREILESARPEQILKLIRDIREAQPLQ